MPGPSRIPGREDLLFFYDGGYNVRKYCLHDDNNKLTWKTDGVQVEVTE